MGVIPRTRSESLEKMRLLALDFQTFIESESDSQSDAYPQLPSMRRDAVKVKLENGSFTLTEQASRFASTP